MFKFWLFTHLVGLSVWLGSLVAVAIVFSLLRKQLVSAEIRKVYVKLSKIFTGVSHATATLVLVSGLIMLFQMEYKAFDVIFMERFGSMVVILSMILLTVFNKKVVKQISNNDIAPEKITGFGAYFGVKFATIVAIIATIFVVSFN